MKNILGLDIGTNSIGSAVVSQEEGKLKEFKFVGSRIIPMADNEISDFNSGNLQSAASQRTAYRSARKVNERRKLRRERLHRILHTMQYLPNHYDNQLGWDKTDNKHYAKFIGEKTPKLAWETNSEGKNEFLFETRYNEMLQEFYAKYPEMAQNEEKVSHDWTIYYLRKVALTQEITPYELAWILLQYNQKRGYYQLSWEDDEALEKDKNKEFIRAKVVSVEKTGETKKTGETWYHVYLDNNLIYKRPSKEDFDWVGQTREFIVTYATDKDGNRKFDENGELKYSMTSPKEDSYLLKKKRSEQELNNSNLSVGAYIYQLLLDNRDEKILGKQIAVIDRPFYKKELQQILTKQKEFHSSLNDKELLHQCAEELYARNINHQNILARSSFDYMLIEDTIFYQRPLKSKKNLIDDCPFESHTFFNKETQLKETKAIKCIAKSNPYFQEFRLWQFLSNLRIFLKETEIEGRVQLDVDVTKQYFKTPQQYTELYHKLISHKDINMTTILTAIGISKKEQKLYRWNFLEDKTQPSHTTHYEFLRIFKKGGIKDITTLNMPENWEYNLWHILYSVTDPSQQKKALHRFIKKLPLEEEQATALKAVITQVHLIEDGYGSYSEKAIKKLLPIVSYDTSIDLSSILDANSQKRINDLITGEFNKEISIQVREKMEKYRNTNTLETLNDFHGIPLWLASYIIYNRHSETPDTQKWNRPEDIDKYLANFKQGGLRNPIVEKIIRETLLVVRDIWKKVGHIDEIHVELGREMKNPKDKRVKATQRNQELENTNDRIRTLLREFSKPEFGIQKVAPHSPYQQELLKLYEEGRMCEEVPNEIIELQKKFIKDTPTMAEINKYKLWLEQGYRSPYTGKVIPLSRLFTADYEVEHVIPKAVYYDNSFNNKVICESAINKKKSNELGAAFIEKTGGEIVGGIKVFTTAEYENFIKNTYFKRNKKKAHKLLSVEIPTQFSEAQLNNTRYISKVILQALSHLVREEGEKESTSKWVIPCTGTATTALKRSWGLNDVWNELIAPRFKRLNEKTGTSKFGFDDIKDGKRFFRTAVPPELEKGFNKKRIDHRHHAMDAIAIACASRSHINFMSNVNAQKGEANIRKDLRSKLCTKDNNGNYQFIKPWDTFTQDAKTQLDKLIVSFKNPIRIISPTKNYTKYIDKNGKFQTKQQTSANHLAIRKPLHKETIYGNVTLLQTESVALNKAIKEVEFVKNKQIKTFIIEQQAAKVKDSAISKALKEKGYEKLELQYYSNEKGEQFVTTRKTFDKLATTLKDEIQIRKNVYDTAIQNILINHLQHYPGKKEGTYDASSAFSENGVNEMNKNIVELNGGKPHKPIHALRVLEKLGEKICISSHSKNKHKYAVAQSGTNLYYGVYINDKGERSYATIPLETVIERLKQHLKPVPETNEKGDQLLFTLHPHDLVYVPEEHEDIQQLRHNPALLKPENVYKVVKFTTDRLYVRPHRIASVIIKNIEIGDSNVMQVYNNNSIKKTCLPLSSDRLGHIHL